MDNSTEHLNPTVVRMEDLLQQPIKTEAEDEIFPNTDTQQFINQTEIQSESVPRGKPKSGRIWKSEKTKFSLIVKTKGIRDNFQKKQALRAELKRVKEASRAIIAAKKAEIEMKKQRRRDNIKRREENRKKAEIVQVIKNPSKIKRMKKKQLRLIEKRDTSGM